MNVYLLGGKPFHTVRNAPCPLMAEQGGKRDTETGIGLSTLCEPVVVVRLSKVDKCTEPLSPSVRSGEIVLKLPTVIGLEYLGIRPVEPRPVEKRIRNIDWPSKTFKHEHRIGILLTHKLHDPHPRRLRDHVASIAPEPVHTLSAPEEEHFCHVVSQLFMGVVQFDKILPHNAPRTRGCELSILTAAEPFGMVRLKRTRPASMVRGKVDEESAASRMHSVYEFPELVDGCGRSIEFRHRRIHGVEIRRGEGTPILAHHRIGCWNGERREGLDNPKAHRIHYVRQTAHDLTE